MKLQKLHVGQIGFVIRSLGGEFAPLLVLDRCEIVEVEDERHVKVILKPDGEPKRLWNPDFIPANRRAIEKAYKRILAVIHVGFFNAYQSPNEPLLSPKKEGE